MIFLILFIFLIAFLTTLILTPKVRLLAIKVGALDQPEERKVHLKESPRLGGLAIYGGFLMALPILFFFSDLAIDWRVVSGILIGATLILTVGYFDDRKGLSPLLKLVFQIFAALIIISAGIQIEFLSHPLNGLIFLGIFAIPVTIFWIVGIVNALNLLDGLDGLAGGITIISAMTLLIVALRTGEIESALLLAALLGSVFGFMRYNFYPAKIFLGDSGSYFLGFILSVTAMMGVLKSTLTISFLIPVLILGVPIYDTLTSIIRRIREGHSIFQADKGHLHHRLLKQGISHPKAVLVIYFICGILNVLALLVAFLGK